MASLAKAIMEVATTEAVLVVEVGILAEKRRQLLTARYHLHTGPMLNIPQHPRLAHAYIGKKATRPLVAQLAALVACMLSLTRLMMAMAHSQHNAANPDDIDPTILTQANTLDGTTGMQVAAGRPASTSTAIPETLLAGSQMITAGLQIVDKAGKEHTSPSVKAATVQAR